MNEKELALYEKIKMCCMLKEQYDNIPEKTNKISFENLEKKSYIDKQYAKQIYIAYLYVVIEGIEESGIQIKKQDEFDRLKGQEYDINGKKLRLEEILKDYRNKTFHNQKRTYYNYDKLYNVELAKCIENINEMIKILEYNFDLNEFVFGINQSGRQINSNYFKDLVWKPICNIYRKKKE